MTTLEPDGHVPPQERPQVSSLGDIAVVPQAEHEGVEDPGAPFDPEFPI
jgi:hypothetical protein